jgi:FkbM family methyltransferase
VYRTTVKKALEAITGVQITNVSPGAFVLASRRTAGRVWFLYESHLKALFEKYGVTHVLDVGANRGQFGRRLRKIYKGRILSFEPLARAYAELKRTSTEDPHWEAYNIALGETEGTKRLYVSEKSEFSSFLESNDYCGQRFGTGARGARTEAVPVRRLDSFLREAVPDLDAARIYLKLDTQGYDMAVYEGLGDARSAVVALQTEVSLVPIYKNMPHWTESVSFFERAGFGVTGLFPVNREALRIIEYDCTMVRVRTNHESRAL